MTERKKKYIHLFYSVYLSVLIINAALHIIFAVCAIYFGANSEFSREIVSTQFAKIAIPVYICLGGIIVGFLLSLFLPVNESAMPKGKSKKDKSKKNYKMIYERLAKKIDLSQCDAELSEKIKKERKLRMIYSYVCLGLTVLSAIPFMIIICNPNRYDKYLINESIIPSVIIMFIWCVLAFIFVLGSSIIRTESMKSEILLLKEAIENKSGLIVEKAETPTAEEQKKKLITVWSIRGAIVTVALVFIIIGICNGGMADVLGKAVRLCTECIGLG
ncbi:MAG: hypothetical protein E7667_00880 [Ruminococcaceae bacterium]|nr:hypothetical protein [Oscillospiraceae bacterium]